MPGPAVSTAGGLASAGWTRLATATAALAALGLAAYVNFHITRYYFWSDDFYHFYRMRNLPLPRFIFEPQGGHLQATTFSIYYAVSWFAGVRPEPYFWWALGTHVLNVLLLFVLVRRVTDSTRLACFGAALWGTSPVLDEPIGWWSVYGHVILATWVLCLLLELASLERGAQPTRATYVRWVALLLLAATSFGMGIGMVLMAPRVASTILHDSSARPVIVRRSRVIAGALPVAYIAFHFVWRSRGIPGIVPPFLIVALLGHLMGYGIARTTLGTLRPEHGFPGIAGALAIALFAGAVILAWRRGTMHGRRWVLACLLLALAAYFMVAVGRAYWYSQNPGLVGNADRYQYVGPLLITVSWCVMLGELGSRVRLTTAWRNALLLLALAPILWGHFSYARPHLYHFEYSRAETANVVRQIVEQVVMAPRGADVFIENQRFLPVGPIFSNSLEAFPGWAGLFVVVFPDNDVAGRRVHFVMSDRRALEAAKHGRRTATLVVAPEDVPPQRGAQPPGSAASRQ